VSRSPEPPSDAVQQIQAMLTRGRLAIDLCDGRRTTFLTHVGAAERLVPGPWIAHRQLVMALALANLAPHQRAALAQTVLVEWGREFGVGRLVLTALASGLPLGGSSLALRPRNPGGEGHPHVLYTWALSPLATPLTCDWLLLRAQPEWALDDAPRSIGVRGLETLAQLGGRVLLCVPDAVAARQVADGLARRPVRHGAPALDAHPRFLPYLEHHEAGAPLLLWPHDALRAPSLERSELSTIVLIGAPEAVRLETLRWAGERPGLEVVDAACPGRVDRKTLAAYWKRCARPKILLRGDPGWTAPGEAWLRSIGAEVASMPAEGTQLGLF